MYRSTYQQRLGCIQVNKPTSDCISALIIKQRLLFKWLDGGGAIVVEDV